jgi:hypothetical protein
LQDACSGDDRDHVFEGDRVSIAVEAAAAST